MSAHCNHCRCICVACGLDELDVNTPVTDGPEGIVAGLEQMLKDAKFKQAYAEGEAERLADHLGKVLALIQYLGGTFRAADEARNVLVEYRDKWSHRCPESDSQRGQR